MKSSFAVKFRRLLLIVVPILICIAVIARLRAVRELFVNTTRHIRPSITCVMITGKDAKRIQLARLAVGNFKSQSYQNKQLLIINHGKQRVMTDDSSSEDNVFEFVVDKEGLTLGDLRNMALQMIPYGGLWTTWDDDDYRSEDYLDQLELERSRTQVDVMCLSKRIDYNRNNGFGWVAHRIPGFVLFLAPYHPQVQYMSKDSMEDVNILTDYVQSGHTVGVFNNDPIMYIRLIHTNNTSEWVDPNKDATNATPKSTVYREYDLSNKQKEFVDKIMLAYYM